METTGDIKARQEPDDKVQAALLKLIGNNFGRGDVKVLIALKGDDLYWLVNLAVEGLKSRKKLFQGDKPQLDMMDRVNLASFHETLKNVVEAVEQGKIAPVKKEKK